MNKSHQEDSQSVGSLDSTGKKKSFRRLCERFAEKTSMQGIPYIHNAKFIWAKVIWTILLLGAVGGMIFHLKFLFDEYYKFDKSTRIELGFDNLKFPAVTVCNTNIIKRSKLHYLRNAAQNDEDIGDNVETLIALVEALRPENIAPDMFSSDQPNSGNANNGNANNGNTNSGNTNGGNTNDGNTNSGNNNPTPPPTQSGRPDSATDGGGNNENTKSSASPGQQTNPSTKSPSPNGQGGSDTNQNSPTPPSTTTRRPRTGGGSRRGNRSTSPPPDGQNPPPDGQNQPPDGQNQPPDGQNPPPRARRQVNNERPPQRPPLHDFDISEFESDYGKYSETLDFDADEYDSPLDTQSKVYNLFTTYYMDLKKKTRENIGHNISEMLIACRFNERICDYKAFRVHQTSEYGNCWTINSNKFVSRQSGPSGGMELVLYLQTEEYLKGLTNGYGVRLVIHRPEGYPFPYDEGFFVSSATETNIALKMKSITRIGSPHGECDDGAEFKEKFDTEYSRQACHATCRIVKLLETCDCFEDGSEEIAISKLQTARPCRSRKEEKCMVDLLRKYDKKEVSCPCPNPCQETVYLRSISQRQWPSDDYAKILLDSACYLDEGACDDLKGRDQRNLNYNFLKLNIYYEDLNFENVTEMPEYEDVQFLSDVGGAIGLWIGLSLLALCELGQLLIELLYYCIHRTVNSGERRERNRERRKNREHRQKEFDSKIIDSNGAKGPPALGFPNVRYEGDSGIGNGRDSPRIDRHLRGDGVHGSPRNTPRHSPHGSPWTQRRMREDFGNYPPTRFYHEY